MKMIIELETEFYRIVAVLTGSSLLRITMRSKLLPGKVWSLMASDHTAGRVSAILDALGVKEEERETVLRSYAALVQMMDEF